MFLKPVEGPPEIENTTDSGLCLVLVVIVVVLGKTRSSLL